MSPDRFDWRQFKARFQVTDPRGWWTLTSDGVKVEVEKLDPKTYKVYRNGSPRQEPSAPNTSDIITFDTEEDAFMEAFRALGV